MPKDNSKGPLLRNTYILLSIIALLSAFIALNYLVFIPRQQSEFNRKAFRIMHEEADDFIQRVKGYADYFQKNHDETKKFKLDTTKWSLYMHDPESAGNRIRSLITVNGLSNSIKKDTCTIDFITDSVIFRYAKDAADTGRGNAQDVLVKSIDEIIQPIQAMHQQTFDYILLINKVRDTAAVPGKRRSERLIYKSPGLAIDNSIYIDSLMKKDAFRFATIHDMEVEGAKYKVFLMPFAFNNQHFYLTGFIEDQGYKIGVTSSSSWAYLVIIVLLLSIMINLPTLKLFLLGKQENIVITDVRMLMVSLTVAPVFFVMALLIIKSYSISDNISNKIMLDLHAQIKRNFSRELDSMVAQLKEYDQNIDGNNFGLMDTAIKPPSDAFFYPRTYKLFDNVSWVEKSGTQIGKWSFLKNNAISFLNVSGRDYFKAIRFGKGFVMKKDSIFIQPTLSWSSGDYSVSVAIPSHKEFDVGNEKKRAILVTLGSIIYSTYNPVLPRPYSFAIIDKDGDVLFHSQSARALHENLFDECDNNPEVLNAVQHNDSVLVSSVNMYDNDVKMLITPIKGLPFYLAGFYNKREQNYFVYHISAFSFVCISVVLISLLFFLYLYYLVGRKVSPLLFSPGESDWMKPAIRKELYYKKLVVFFVMLIALIIIVSIVIFEFCNAHWLILDMAVLSCFLAVTGYYIMKKGVPTNRRAEQISYRKLLYPHRKILLFFALILFLISLIIVFYTESLWWLTIPWIFSIIVLGAVFKIGSMPHFRFMERDYLQHYVWAIFLSIILISVLPTFIFFKYALEHEKYLQVKSRQIYLAERIVQRSSFIDSAFSLTKISKYHQPEDSTFINNVKYKMGYGIYSAFSNVLDTVVPSFPKRPNSVDSFYKVVTQFLFLPSDHSDFFNNTPYYGWSDKVSKNTVNFYYKKDINSNDNRALLIETSLLGLDFSLITDLYKSFLGWILLSVLVTSLIVHFRVIKALARRVFLNEFPGIDISDHTDKNWIDRHVNLKTVAEHDMGLLEEVERSHRKRKVDAAGDDDLDDPGANGDKLLRHEKFTISHSHIYGYESEEMEKSNYANVLRMQSILTSTYDDIWKELSEKEKFILFDFALDGFTNYKNPDTLYGLFKKGLLRQDRENGGLILMTYSFRNYLISKSDTAEIERLRRIVNRGGTWKLIQNIFFVTLLMVFAYLIITRQEVSTKIAAIISGLVSLVPALIKLFDRKTAESTEKA
ncbi:cache domain-containing protein [Pinibacter soli]|uniref:Cache domain-containing protein n=1 Tax=Pinibacter soli TaxID=3044211 RepID=A0ABT6RGH5_9BACT|nr:cache domain-containing protein [Pinibacter soli]MDI3321671.1 cache domain-containing protein [Pinibacter soli]